MNSAEKKPVCKYGSSCYRKNPDHLKQFSHPKDEPSEARKRARDQQSNQQDSTHREPSPPTARPCATEESTAKRLKTENVTSISSSDSADDRREIKTKFLVDMPEDFYQFWKFCHSINPSKPQDALQCLGLQLGGPYHVLTGKLTSEPWERCVLHWRYYYDPPELQTVIRGQEQGFHIGYFRDAPDSTECLVVANSSERNCELIILGDNMFTAIRHELTAALDSNTLSPEKRAAIGQLNSKLTSFITENGLSTRTVKDLIKARKKETQASCFHKIGLVVPYDRQTEVGYRSLSMNDRDLKRLLDRIASCEDSTKRDQLSEPLQEIVTYVQFANDECDYGMGLELGLDLFCHGGTNFHSLIEHLLSVAYELLGRQSFGDICTQHLKNRSLHPLDLTLTT